MNKTVSKGGLHPSQKFVSERIHRSKIKNAPYNPRSIDDHARKKLHHNLKKKGLLDALVWNKRTGNLVSGHQRLSILDDLSATGDDYTLDFAVGFFVMLYLLYFLFRDGERLTRDISRAIPLKPEHTRRLLGQYSVRCAGHHLAVRLRHALPRH